MRCAPGLRRTPQPPGTDRARAARLGRSCPGCPEAGSPFDAGSGAVGVARIHLAAGRTAQAVAALRSARDGLMTASDSAEGAAALQTLGKLLAEAGELQDAHDALQSALQAQERLGTTRG